MNYMKQVAQMLGVELEEEFELKERYGLYRISKSGLYRILGNEWKRDDEARLILSLILNGHYTVKKKSERILDDKEKEYLSHIIEPFCDIVECIAKHEYTDEYEYINIIYIDPAFGRCSIEFPCFEKSAMYKGMEENKEYSLEDLEL